MKRYYWQPSIDNWVLKEETTPTTMAPMSMNNSSQNVHVFGADHMSNGVPVKSEEEEEVHDKLDQPYKGITTLKRLKDQIDQILGDVKDLSKTGLETDKGVDNEVNPYEQILTILKGPELNTMLQIASEEVGSRKISSF